MNGQENKRRTHRGWVYEKQGDYHRNLDPNWSYTPTYLRKMVHVDRFLNSLPKGSRVLDVGCGEGVLVERYMEQGWQMEGIDLNYSSKHVRQENVLQMSAADGTYDAVLFLDVLEHLTFENQPKALKEIQRVLKEGGRLLLMTPNLAHLNSRWLFFFRGHLDRTDDELNHLGERPFSENLKLLRDVKFSVSKVSGITVTLPFVYRRLICKHAARLRWLHDMLEPFASPSFAMLTVFECTKAKR